MTGYGPTEWNTSIARINALKTDDAAKGIEKKRYWQPHRDDVVMLFGWALITQGRLNRFLIKFGRLTRGVCYLEKGVKSLLRIQEKMSVRFDWKERGYSNPNDPSSVWDYVRGMVTYNWIWKVKEAMENHLLNKDLNGNINIISIWNRFTEEPNGKWQDVMVHLMFDDVEEEHRVICEVQLCYVKFTTARKKFGGHDAYSDYRNAGEIERCAQFVTKQQS